LGKGKRSEIEAKIQHCFQEGRLGWKNIQHRGMNRFVGGRETGSGKGNRSGDSRFRNGECASREGSIKRKSPHEEKRRDIERMRQRRNSWEQIREGLSYKRYFGGCVRKTQMRVKEFKEKVVYMRTRKEAKRGLLLAALIKRS